MPFARPLRAASVPAPVQALVLSALVAPVLSVMMWVLAVSPASAESPTELAEEVADDGVYVAASRRGFDEAALIAAVADARSGGVDLVVIVPNDPQPTAKAFARRIQEKTEADAALVFPSEGPAEVYVIDELSTARPRALEAARSLTDPAQAVAAFADELTTVSDAGRPAIIGQILRALLLFAVVVGAILGIENLVSRPGRTASSAS